MADESKTPDTATGWDTQDFLTRTELLTDIHFQPSPRVPQKPSLILRMLKTLADPKALS